MEFIHDVTTYLLLSIVYDNNEKCAVNTAITTIDKIYYIIVKPCRNTNNIYIKTRKLNSKQTQLFS